ncbi:hypothetical protein BD324DRAFT_643833 [Kockovaella imperatae]|uniref:Peptide hydrolase n=1 Tax=Kockovaella imperatae TaxID=4999 RepID=A0A1Y1U996_9TREE|nr:hypothetical protein BD324DRAFT_643833 [Kockovaella imperatae]ORX33665.1 hypothetical protein BD324DRAFT_643833 [Kockovaella imperatae]
MRLLEPVPLILITLLSLHSSQAEVQSRDFYTLSSSEVRTLAESDPPQWQDVNEGHLGKLLVPRLALRISEVSLLGPTDSSALVQEYISTVFSRLGWHEEKDSFTDTTPIGQIDFTNLIYTFDPSAPRKIVLAAHFDSKWFPNYPDNQFVGATDSAAPCAMLLDLAENLTPLLRARQQRIEAGQGILRDGLDEEEAAETTLQILFFDGEEAFHDWTTTDSIYGARHLAQRWEDTILEPDHPLAKRRYAPLPNVLDTIDVLVLLDLLGNSRSRISSYYRETDWLFDQLSEADRHLRQEGLVEVEAGEEGWFSSQRQRRGMIGDDHVPFVERGVSILHVISFPFPNVWHRISDDASALSLPALRRWNRILRVFTAGYLGLSPTPGQRIARHGDELVCCSV